MRHLEGSTLAEIAAACDLSVSTVKRRLNRARSRFLKLAKEDFVLSATLGELFDEA